MPQENHTLTPLQEAKVEAATRLFDRYVGNDRQVQEFQRRLTNYVAQHPTWSVADSAVTISERVLSKPNYQPAGGDAGGSDVDANFTIRAQFRNEIQGVLAGDPAVQRLQREENARAASRWNELEVILTQSSVPLNMNEAGAAIDRIQSHFTNSALENDKLEARALVAAVDTLVNTTGISSLLNAWEHGQTGTTLQGRNAARYQEAKEDIIEVLRSHGISRPQDADVTAILGEAVPIARAAIAQRDGNQR